MLSVLIKIMHGFMATLFILAACCIDSESNIPLYALYACVVYLAVVAVIYRLNER